MNPYSLLPLAVTALLLFASSVEGAALRRIGSTPQYFLDDSLVETTQNTRPRLNPAVKVPTNPIIKSDKPWEGSDNRIQWVIFDENHQQFRMRYSTGDYIITGRNQEGEFLVERRDVKICEAFSSDGVHWTKPNLGLVSFEGSTDNNIIPPEKHRDYFFQDMHDPDPDKRYKGHFRKGGYDDPGMTFELFYSRDAYEWIPYEGNPTVDTGNQQGRWGPTHFLGWDPIRRVYAVHMENNLHMHSPYARRSIGRAESADLTEWSTPETLIVADANDYPDTEFYAMPTTFRDGLAFGFLWDFSSTNTTFTPQLAFSRDGVTYNRTYRSPVIHRGDPGDFDSVGIYANRPIFQNGKIYCFYTGVNWRSPHQLEELGNKAEAGIGLALLPEGGFVSLEGARLEYSSVTTRSFSFTGTSLYLNIQAAIQQWGAEPCRVEVEILDERHIPIEPFRFENCDSLTETSRHQKVTWNGSGDLSALEGRPVRLKIRFKNAKLYGFQFQ